MDNKVDGKTWVRVTILVAIVGCIGALGAAFIGILPDILNNSKPSQTETPANIPSATATSKSSIPNPTDTPMPIKVSDILFQDNFDDGKSDQWKVHQGLWEVIQDESGNHVYQGNANNNQWAFATPKTASFSWRNYAIELRWRVIQISDQNDDNDADGQVTFRVQYDKPSGCSYYGVFFDTAHGFVSLARQGFNPDCNWANLVDRSFGFQTGKWYNMRIETSGTNHKVFIENVLFLEANDVSVTQGIFEIDAAPGAIVQFDDVKVWALAE